jgi:cell division protein FtsB
MLKARYWEASDQQEELEKALKPLTDKRDALVANIQALEAQKKPIDEAIRREERPIRELQEERVFISRALGGKIGSRPTS